MCVHALYSLRVCAVPLDAASQPVRGGSRGAAGTSPLRGSDYRGAAAAGGCLFVVREGLATPPDTIIYRKGLGARPGLSFVVYMSLFCTGSVTVQYSVSGCGAATKHRLIQVNLCPSAAPDVIEIVFLEPLLPPCCSVHMPDL